MKHGLAEADRKPRNLNANAKEGQSSISPLSLLFFCMSSLPVWALSLVTDERPAAKCETPPFQSDAASFPASRGKCSVQFSHRPTGAVYKIIGPEMNYLSVVGVFHPCAIIWRCVMCQSTGASCRSKKNKKIPSCMDTQWWRRLSAETGTLWRNDLRSTASANLQHCWVSDATAGRCLPPFIVEERSKRHVCCHYS